MNQILNNAVNTDYYLPETIEDTISSIKFHPNNQSNILSTCGWDSKVRLWTIMNQGAQIKSNANTIFQLDNPLLSLCWQGDTPSLFTSSTDGTITHIDITKGQKSLLGKHDSGCKEVVFIPRFGILISGGWDGKVNIWDLRLNIPVMSYGYSHKVYTMSASNDLLVIGLSERAVSYFNLGKLQQKQFQSEALFESHLKHQTKKVCCFPNGDGYAIGGIDGRLAIKNVNLNLPPKIQDGGMTSENDFAYKCHRVTTVTPNEVYPVNDIAFNQRYGTFATVGGDGSYVMWDKDSKTRLAFGQLQNKCPITACEYSFNGDLFAYAAGYDWEKGIGGDGEFIPKIGIHYCSDLDKLKRMK